MSFLTTLPICILLTNNTIYGSEWQIDPEVPAGVPLIADASSNFMSKTHGCKQIFSDLCGAQKNVGPAGCVVVIVKKDYLNTINEGLPSMLDYNTYHKAGSMFNTPPTFTIYMIGLVLKWIENFGGLDKVHQHNLTKAGYIYDVIDKSDGFYKGHVVAEDRSLMNITFRLSSEELEAKFISEAAAKGMIGLERTPLHRRMPRQHI